MSHRSTLIFNNEKSQIVFTYVTVGQERLNDLCLFSVYKEQVQELDIAILMKDFSRSIVYRIQIFGLWDDLYENIE